MGVNIYVDLVVWTALLVSLAALPVVAFVAGVREGVRRVQARPGVTVSSSGRVVLTTTEAKEPGPLVGYSNITEAARK